MDKLCSLAFLLFQEKTCFAYQKLSLTTLPLFVFRSNAKSYRQRRQKGKSVSVNCKRLNSSANIFLVVSKKPNRKKNTRVIIAPPLVVKVKRAFCLSIKKKDDDSHSVGSVYCSGHLNLIFMLVRLPFFCHGQQRVDFLRSFRRDSFNGRSDDRKRVCFYGDTWLPMTKHHSFWYFTRKKQNNV